MVCGLLAQRESTPLLMEGAWRPENIQRLDLSNQKLQVCPRVVSRQQGSACTEQGLGAVVCGGLWSTQSRRWWWWWWLEMAAAGWGWLQPTYELTLCKHYSMQLPT